MKRWQTLLLGACLVLQLCLPSWAASPATQTVTVRGEAALSLGLLQAREEALSQARRMAVEQAMGVYVLSETLVENMSLVHDSILTRSSGYISAHKVLSETQQNGILEIQLEAVVSVEPLVEQLAQMGLLRDWTVAVVLVPGAESQSSAETAKNRLHQQILAKGFKVADEQALVALRQPAVWEPLQKGNPLASLPVLRDLGVDVLIVGTSLTRMTEDGVMETYGGIKTVMTQGRIDARAIRVDTGEMLAAQSFQAVAGGSGREMAEARAIEQAASKAGDFFALQIAKLPAATTQMLQLHVQGLSFSREQAFQTQLKQVAGVRTVQRKVYRNQQAQYEIAFSGKADLLANALIGHSGLKAFGFDIQSITAGLIEASAK